MEYEVLNIVDELNDIEFMSEMAVMDAMLDVYTKQATMLCYMPQEVVQECCYVQEGLMDDIKVGIKGVSGESVLKKILLFIPRLIASFVKWIGSKFSKKTPEAAVQQAAKAAQSLTPEEAEAVDTITKVADEIVAKGGTEPTPKQVQEVKQVISRATGSSTSNDTKSKPTKTPPKGSIQIGQNLKKMPGWDNVEYSPDELDKYGHRFFTLGHLTDRELSPEEKAELKILREKSKLTPEEDKRYRELAYKTRDVGFLYVTDDSVYEIIRTAVSYRAKFYSRLKLHVKDGYNGNAEKSYYTVDKLRQFSMALQSGKIKSGIDVADAKNHIDIYEKFVKLLKQAVLDFDNKNSSFQKFEKDINAAHAFSEKEKIIYNSNFITTVKRGHSWSKTTGGVEIDINNFSKDLIEIRDRMDNIVKDCQELSKRIQYDYNERSIVSDIDKAVDERRKNGRKEFSAARKKMIASWNKDLAEGKTTKDAYDRNMKLIDDSEFGDTDAAKLAKAYSRLASDLRLVTNFCKRVVEEITLTEDSCTSYVKIVQLYKKNGSGYTRKGIKKMPHKVQRTPKQRTYEVNKDNDLSNKQSLGIDLVL